MHCIWYQDCELLSLCKAREKDVEKHIAMGHRRERQEKIEKASTAIITALCNMDGMTVGTARNALKIAAETLEDT